MVGQIQSATDVWAQIKSAMSQASDAMQAAPDQSGAQTAPANGPATEQTPAASTPVQVVDSVTLTQFERARVTYQASSEPGRAYAYNATLTYERIAYSQASTQSAGTAANDSTLPPAEDQTASAQDAQTPAAPATAPDTSVVLLHHVVINATAVWQRQLTAHVVATPAASVASTATPQTSATAASDSTDPAPQPPTIRKLSVDDFAALRARTVDRSRESTLALKLTTQEGDLVELTFRQLDVLTQTRLKGVTDSGDRVRASDTTGSSERNVNMQITGDLSDAEKAAIDSVLQNVVDVANQFFHGDLQAAMAKMTDVQIDTGQLADVSLKMSMTQSSELNKVAIGDDGQLQQLAHRETGVSQALEFLADQQRTLIAAAKTQFDDHSAVKLVKQLLPALLAPVDPNGPTSASSSPDAATQPAAGAPVSA
jgi:hypothetical protein